MAARAALALLVPCSAWAQASLPPASGARPDQAHIEARSETFLRVFQRALLPGPNGAIVDTQTLAPIYEYASVRARDVEPPWRAGSVDAEVSVWGEWLLTGDDGARRFDGDVTSAFVQQRLGTARLRIGRQSFGSAAAQYIRFDGARAGAHLLPELGADVYAGWTVLPRWDARPGYQQLGSARDGLVRDPEALADAERGGWFVAGGRAYFDSPRVAAGVSFHDERQQHALARRNFGLDLKLAPLEAVSVAANSTLSSDGARLVDARAWVDVTPGPEWLISGEYLHANPALLLSRQSVLSVFGTSAFDEWGGTLTVRPLRHVSLSGSAYAQHIEGEGLGLRSQARLSATPDPAERLRLELAHSRLLGAGNGYHSLRAAIGYTLSAHLSSSADAWLYRYDEPILGERYSLVQALNVSYHTESALALLGGVSRVQSPYARADIQSLLRVSLALGGR